VEVSRFWRLGSILFSEAYSLEKLRLGFLKGFFVMGRYSDLAFVGTFYASG